MKHWNDSGKWLALSREILLLPSNCEMRNATIKDSEGLPVGDGDTIKFSYGIPPVVVVAKIVKRGERLIALTPGHNPEQSNLRSLRRHVGNWYKLNSKVIIASLIALMACGCVQTHEIIIGGHVPIARIPIYGPKPNRSLPQTPDAPSRPND